MAEGDFNIARDFSIITANARLPMNGINADTNAMAAQSMSCLLYTSPSPRDRQKSRMPSSA